MKHKKTISLLFLSFLLLFTACSSSKIKGEIEYGKTSLRAPFQAIYGKDGAYIFRKDNVFFYKNGESQRLFSLRVVDDRAVNVEGKDGGTSEAALNFERYSSSKYQDFTYIMGERLYYISELLSAKGSSKYYLSSVNLLGKDKVDHIFLKDKPTGFFIADDYFIISFNVNDKIRFAVYDKDLKEQDLNLDGKNIEAIYKSLVFYSSNNKEGKNELCVYDLKTGEDSLFSGDSGSISAIGDGYVAISVWDIPQSDTIKSFGKVYKIDGREKICVLKNRTILEFNGGNFYAFDSLTGKSYYEYDINGNLISKVDNPTYLDAFFIVTVKDREAIAISNKTDRIYYHIDFKNQKIEPIEVK